MSIPDSSSRCKGKSLPVDENGIVTDVMTQELQTRSHESERTEVPQSKTAQVRTGPLVKCELLEVSMPSTLASRGLKSSPRSWESCISSLLVSLPARSGVVPGVEFLGLK